MSCREGAVYCWGAGSKGQLGLGPDKVTKLSSPTRLSSLASATDVFCGQYFTIVKLASGEIVGFGDNKHQQVSADPALRTVTEPRQLAGLSAEDEVSCGWTHLAVTGRGGEVSVRGRDNYHQRGGGGVVMRGVVRALAGSEHCVCLTSEGAAWAWGWNEHGSCGLEPGADTECVARPARLPLDNVTAIFVGSAHCFAVVAE